LLRTRLFFRRHDFVVKTPTPFPPRRLRFPNRNFVSPSVECCFPSPFASTANGRPFAFAETVPCPPPLLITPGLAGAHGDSLRPLPFPNWPEPSPPPRRIILQPPLFLMSNGTAQEKPDIFFFFFVAHQLGKTCCGALGGEKSLAPANPPPSSWQVFFFFRLKGRLPPDLTFFFP